MGLQAVCIACLLVQTVAHNKLVLGAELDVVCGLGVAQWALFHAHHGGIGIGLGITVAALQLAFLLFILALFGQVFLFYFLDRL